MQLRREVDQIVHLHILRRIGRRPGREGLGLGGLLARRIALRHGLFDHRPDGLAGFFVDPVPIVQAVGNIAVLLHFKYHHVIQGVYRPCLY